MKVPEYRVRLFLSVDLTGSTAFKHKSKDTLVWIKAFQNFYGQFPQILDKKFGEVCDSRGNINFSEKEAGRPKLWKTIGDEILFCCRLTSLCHLGACIDAFVEALKEFGEVAREFDLNTKGNAWVASFPTPNCSIMPIQNGVGLSTDALNGKSDLPTEDNEQEVDADPSKFDFLGKGIDAGFRISKNSAIDTLTISPGLAILLAKAAETHLVTDFKKSIRFSEMQVFKGVADSNPYPVLTIDTSRDVRHEDLLTKQRVLLAQPSPPKSPDLADYLTDYLNYFEIEIPAVKMTFSQNGFVPPAFYGEYCKKWHDAAEGVKAQDKQFRDSFGSASSEPETNSSANSDLNLVVESLPTT
jgi:hypothetical protein